MMNEECREGKAQSIEISPLAKLQPSCVTIRQGPRIGPTQGGTRNLAWRVWSYFLVSLCLGFTLASQAAESLLDRVLALNQIQEPELDVAEMKKVFAGLVEDCRKEMKEAAGPRERVSALNRKILAGRKVTYLSNLTWRDSTLAAALLRGRGNCLATTTLFVLVARELDLPIYMVIVPEHAFARWDDGKSRINIETTAEGRERSDEDYFVRGAQATPADRQALGWGRTLNDEAFLAELKWAAAGHLRSRNEIGRSLELIEEVCKSLPYRSDLRLEAIMLRADLTGDRQAAISAAYQLLRENPPPATGTGALLFLAEEAAARKRFDAERQLLLEAFAQAPKFSQQTVLSRLAFCHRSLKDWPGAARYQELAVALTPPGSPELAEHLYNLAILQKNEGHLPKALVSIERALKINPESWNLRVIQAGYLVLAGQREEGVRLFQIVPEPRTERDFWLTMQAWFHAVAGDRARFYPAFEKALSETKDPHVLVWLEQDVDLDPYRKEEPFIRLVAQHRKRLLGEEPKAETGENEGSQ